MCGGGDSLGCLDSLDSLDSLGCDCVFFITLTVTIYLVVFFRSRFVPLD